MNIALALVRIVIGLTYAGHGSQKLFGWFGGYGLTGTGQWMESLGLKPGKLMALLAGLAELIGGLLLATGSLLPIAATLLIVTMLVAIITVHRKNGYWVTQNGFEYPLILIVVILAVTLIGPGSYAIHLFS
ncbi:DoxX family protein [Sulfobacillus thermosulfidooxidans]|uniref:Putative oxidoreductase n=1 Tax=Sulfobacillus thermosulfidooxidans (strain DSM 9293 / VKM B-1269 / AT-1) TaxID=929705 RepID=A0A1W1WI31_SULTA|nr:DoxX family protein [Sulfobacillus thermosulfidooxidans]OLZ10301.1 oxidoreductase [Sulfobacillus thermosulfidooxidans]OLZ13262.1 oxidoreductase [Sulfobacillus thermosulfidooxidans]OLZ21642.1 oxidoreductase [Sulfobacillus thermosulfidooxidans]SMC05927.1 putative oxidoreductase [Sulfobacillus thermosulfidooxidans DSM 9293]